MTIRNKMAEPDMLRGDMQRARVRVVLAAAAAAMAVLPPFLLTVLFPLLSDDIGISRQRISALMPLFFLTSAATAPSVGRLVARLGTRPLLAVAGTLNAAALLAIPAAVWHAAVLIPGAIVGGVANGLVQPAANQVIVNSLSSRRGLGIGVKQAAFPAATFVAGLAVPLAARAIAWEVTIVMLAAVVMLVTIAAARQQVAHAAPHVPPVEPAVPLTHRGVAIVTTSAFLSVVAAASVAALFVDFAVETGKSATSAGMALAAASLASACSRLVLGDLADRRGPSLLAVALPMLAAAPGYVALSAWDSSASLLVGLFLALAVGWGWDGALLYGVIVRSRRSAASSTGIVIAGLALGSGVGPPIVSLIAGEDGDGYREAWALNGGVALIGGLLMLSVHFAASSASHPEDGRSRRPPD